MNEKQMQDMAVSILLDEYTQLDVAQLLKEYDEAEENGELPNISDALDEKCEEMIRREFVRKKQKKILAHVSKVLSRVAMIVLMLIGLCTVSVLSVKAWREPALRFVLETFERRSSVSIEGTISQVSKTPEEIIERLMEIVPETYELMQKHIQDGQYQIMYANKNGKRINLIITTQWFAHYFDTEKVEGNQVLINGYDAIVVQKGGYSIMWLDEEQHLLYDLYATDINKEELLNFAYALTK